MSARVRARRLGAVVAVMVMTMGIGWRVGSSAGADTASGSAMSGATAAPDEIARAAEIARERRDEADRRRRCPRHRRCDDDAPWRRPRKHPHRRATSTTFTTVPTTPSTTPTTAGTTTTTLRRCNPAVARCPRDVSAKVAALGYTEAGPSDISDRGEIVGSGFLPELNGSITGFRLPADGPARLLRDPQGGLRSNPYAANASGLVVGSSFVNGAVQGPTVWGADDRPIDLTPRLPAYGGQAVDGEAVDVNAAGQVVGNYTLFAPTGADLPAPSPMGMINLGFVWDSRTDTMTVLNPEDVTAGGDGGLLQALAIGDSGVVGGADTTFDPNRVGTNTAARWLPVSGGGYRRELLGPGTVFGVDSTGNAVGILYDDVWFNPVHWPAGSTTATPLPPRPGAPADRTLETTEPVDINDAGVIAGYTVTRMTGETTALRWPARASRPPDVLDGNGWPRAATRAINRAGTVVGIGEPAWSLGSGWAILVWDR
jgi:hypothetical protein